MTDGESGGGSIRCGISPAAMAAEVQNIDEAALLHPRTPMMPLKIDILAVLQIATRLNREPAV